ncbi:MAG: KDGP aldolase family protein, partial [Erysipelothrix sp.]|nr:KDGP aldolase family protein [Erysipelothrix sp.]
MSKTINFYKDRVALNFLAGSYENGKESLDACDGFG